MQGTFDQYGFEHLQVNSLSELAVVGAGEGLVIPAKVTDQLSDIPRRSTLS